MSGDIDLLVPEAGSLRRGRFTYFPVAPGRLEFAAEVRAALLEARPPVVAVELPATLERAYLRALGRLPQISVIFYPEEGEEDADTAIYVPVEPADPFVEAIRTAQEIGAEVIFADPDAGERPHLMDLYPDPYSIWRIGLEKYVEAYRLWPQPRSEEIARHAEGIAWKLQGCDPLAEVFVVVSLNLLDAVLDAMEQPQAQPMARVRRSGVEVLNPHPESLAEITLEYPALQWRYEQFREDTRRKNLIERRHAQLAVLREAEKSYESNTGERVQHWQRRLLARYGRNLALAEDQLIPGLYDLAVAARSVVDDNYAWEVWETAGRYPPQKETSDATTVKISGEEVWLDTRHMRLRRRLPSAKRKLRPVGLKPRRKEKTPGEWARQLDGAAICSYPPEDLVVEDYGRFLKKKGKSLLSEERAHVEPFTTSILDGIDLRETIRNWHERRIYVREYRKAAGEVGSVVVIFDEDREDRYTYLTTWLGENQNESDMAFYATQPFEHLVGPGIGRAEYGGFLMSLPPRRMYDVWHDPDYDFAETKPERLLVAALDYSLERFVVYVAARPPRSMFRSVAARMGRTIVYIPIGQLSPVALKKVRVVHVLDGYDKREIAREYIMGHR
ncbi:MAG: hypothetical protein M1436_05075 [Acidobacteria bacterium]|nr:hypothetical protein [Acidobacteriota bacterium]